MDTILNVLPLDEAQRQAFRAAAPWAEHIFRPTSDFPNSAMECPPDEFTNATIVVGCVGPEFLRKCPSLKWCQTWSAGVDPYLAPGALQEGVMVTSAVGAYGQSVSEVMLASLLSLMKRLPAYRDNQHAQRWADTGRVKTLRGETVLLLGTGDIGSHLAELVKALGARTVGLNRHPEKALHNFDELHSIAQLDDYLPQAGVVAMSLPGTPETAGLMDARRLALMRPDAILLNAGRGSAVDCLALAQALQSGKLWGAALDVTEPEPLPQGHPLWDCEALVLTPHVAGGDHLPCILPNIVDIALENLRRYHNGEPLRNRMR